MDLVILFVFVYILILISTFLLLNSILNKRTFSSFIAALIISYLIAEFAIARYYDTATLENQYSVQLLLSIISIFTIVAVILYVIVKVTRDSRNDVSKKEE